jgi:chromosome segregation ATPase
MGWRTDAFYEILRERTISMSLNQVKSRQLIDETQDKLNQILTKLDEQTTKLDKATLDLEEIKNKQKALNRRLTEVKWDL